jgi:hypothetical protein
MSNKITAELVHLPRHPGPTLEAIIPKAARVDDPTFPLRNMLLRHSA